LVAVGMAVTFPPYRSGCTDLPNTVPPLTAQWVGYQANGEVCHGKNSDLKTASSPKLDDDMATAYAYVNAPRLSSHRALRRAESDLTAANCPALIKPQVQGAETFFLPFNKGTALRLPTFASLRSSAGRKATSRRLRPTRTQKKYLSGLKKLKMRC
jgi:hypothetical protein